MQLIPTGNSRGRASWRLHLTCIFERSDGKLNIVLGPWTVSCMTFWWYQITSGTDTGLPVVTTSCPTFSLLAQLSHFEYNHKWCHHFQCNWKWCSRDNSALGKELAISQGVYGMKWLLPAFLWDQRRRLRREELPGLKEEKMCLRDHSWTAWPEWFSEVEEIQQEPTS